MITPSALGGRAGRSRGARALPVARTPSGRRRLPPAGIESVDRIGLTDHGLRDVAHVHAARRDPMLRPPVRVPVWITRSAPERSTASAVHALTLLKKDHDEVKNC